MHVTHIYSCVSRVYPDLSACYLYITRMFSYVSGAWYVCIHMHSSVSRMKPFVPRMFLAVLVRCFSRDPISS